MKIIIVLLLFFVSLQHLQAQSHAAKAAEEVKLLSQKFANDYLFLYCDPNHFKYLPKLKKSIDRMERNLRIIAKDTSNEDIHSVLDYLSYTKDELYYLMKNDVDRENVQKILDNTDSLVEGVDSILQSMRENFFKEELQYHILKLSKLYMAIHLNFSPSENSKILSEELHTIEKMMQNINRNIYISWHAYKKLFNSEPHYFIPHIIAIAVDDLEESIAQL